MNLLKKYTKGEEFVNAISHGVGILMGIVVCTIFLVKGYRLGNTVVQVSLWLYLFGVVSSYLFSTLYHSFPIGETKQTLRKLDHSAIYWHIAGSYSPITLIVLYDAGYWGWGIFIFCWLCAIVGTCMSLFALKRHNYIETTCFVLMGLVILVAIKHFYERVDGWVFFLVLAEGVSYITGAVLYSFHKVKYIHSVFHFFVLLGDVCHMVAVWMILEKFLG
ncbi:MAG: hemolysin III family protein [Bacteroidaceae bacterium]|nr:hemolysin III family protein [Bacteroidaceae bacterium]